MNKIYNKYFFIEILHNREYYIMLNKLYKNDKIYIKLIIGKIIESKLNKIHNNISTDKISLNFNYLNIKNEFKNIINHKGGNIDFFFNEYPQTMINNGLYTREIFLPYETVFTNNEISSSDIKKILVQIVKIKTILNKNYDNIKENEAINKLNYIIDIINNDLLVNNKYDKNEINNIFIKLIKIIKNFNEIECIKLQNKYPDIYEKVSNLCKIL